MLSLRSTAVALSLIATAAAAQDSARAGRAGRAPRPDTMKAPTNILNVRLGIVVPL